MSNTDWLDPHFGTVSAVIVVAAVAYTAWSGLVESPRRYRALVAARADDRTDEARRFYRRALIVQLGRCLVVLAVVGTDAGVSRRDLGLVWPVGSAATVWGTFAYFCAALMLSTIVMRRRALGGRSVPGQRLFDAIIPRQGERLLATGLAIGAGVSEELLFRGLLLAAAVDLLRVTPSVALLIVSIGFGAMHRYQGWWGVIGTSLVGLVLGGLYLTSHSLLVPVLIHILVDLRGVLFVPLVAARTTNEPRTGR